MGHSKQYLPPNFFLKKKATINKLERKRCKEFIKINFCSISPKS